VTSNDPQDIDSWIRQAAVASRDVFAAGRDQTILFVPDPPAARQPYEPAVARARAWGEVPPRNRRFTGRKKQLGTIRRQFVSSDRAVVQALLGIGGVGKTQLATEYTHRFADSYDVVWWIAAEQPELIGLQVAALGVALGCSGPAADVEAARRAVLMTLRERERWLLIFDNAENPEELTRWLPGGNGHVLITSRLDRWAEIAVPVEIDVLDRAESVKLLRRTVSGLRSADAARLAAALGDLPLAIVQAATYMAGTFMSAASYTELLAQRAADLMDLDSPSSHPRSLAAVTTLELERLRAEAPAAADLAAVCAFLAPEPFRPGWFTSAASALPVTLVEATADQVGWGKTVSSLGGSALARKHLHGLLMHRLTQSIVRGSLPPARAEAARAAAETVLGACHPGDAEEPANWSDWALLLPHMLVMDLAATADHSLRVLACDAARYLIVRGDLAAGRDLADGLYLRWQERHGPENRDALAAGTQLVFALRELSHYGEAHALAKDIFARCGPALGDEDPDTLSAAFELAACLHRLGDFEQARELDGATLTARRRILGEDHPRTLYTAANLAAHTKEQGDLYAALKLEVDTLIRRCRVLGTQHHRTLESANNLAVTLSLLGHPQTARKLDEQVLAGFRDLFGGNHHRTLTQATNLAEDLRDLGDLQAARELDEQALTGLRRVLGRDHSMTLTVAHNLACDLRALGEFEAARQLEKDTLARRRRVLRHDHHDAQISADALASDLLVLEQLKGDRERDESA
jgi:tetratricopeptide (TPR) repeat protein